ncbi:MAG: DUF1587 domain-containing protein, partial [Pirellulales bacterium]
MHYPHDAAPSALLEGLAAMRRPIVAGIIILIRFLSPAVCAAEEAGQVFDFANGATGVIRGNDQHARADAFRKNVAPVLAKYCFDCHGEGNVTAEVAFDQFTSDRQLLESRELWWKVLKQLRAGLMPPQGEARPSTSDVAQIEGWVKSAVFQIDPNNPDPGHVTVRRLNRVEYRNTVRDLIGVNYDTSGEFPADDTGYGFDNIGDVLTISPLLLEKYLGAADTIVKQADRQRLFPRDLCGAGVPPAAKEEA